MVAGRTPQRNFRHDPGTKVKTELVDGTPLLALRLGPTAHALDPGRDYLFGKADDCDFRIDCDAERLARIEVRTDGVTLHNLGAGVAVRHNDQPITHAVVAAGDVLSFGSTTATVVADDGEAALVPIPALRRAAVERRMSAVRSAAAALRWGDDESFARLVASELRRAPWLAISLVLHLLLLLLLWSLTPQAQPIDQSYANVHIELRTDAPTGTRAAVVPDVVPESASDLADLMSDPELSSPDSDAAEQHGPAPARTRMPTSNPKLAPRLQTMSSGSERSIAQDKAGVESGSFRQTVAELQESGLDIMFVFDSTGSMTRTILDTKSTIVQMLAVLRMLVPDARVGLVTYRDDGRHEEYLVRQVPLDIDYWRATNFVQFVIAEGGGDRPEGVRAGLNAAFEQHWRPGARRVIVLAGDAPPHRSDVAPMLSTVRRFTLNGRSFVHTLVTTPDRAGDDTHEQFADIAAAGGGVTGALDEHERVLQRVLTLAFGHGFDRDIAAVIAAAELERDRVDVEALHLARTGGDELARALLRKPVSTKLWNALVRRPRRATVEQLIELLAARKTPDHTRHAIAAALQRIFDLAVPPIDPITSQRPTMRRIKRLRRMADRLNR